MYFSSGLNLTSSDMLNEKLNTQQDSMITIPATIVDNIPNYNAVRIAFAIFTETRLFPVRRANVSDNDTSSVVGSQVVSASVAGIADGATLSAPVSISMRLTNTPELNSNEEITGRRCVYWDHTAASKWS